MPLRDGHGAPAAENGEAVTEDVRSVQGGQRISGEDDVGGPTMPYALFDDDLKISRAYPTEADVWHHARQSGLTVQVTIEDDAGPPPLELEPGYSIRPCELDPGEDPERNEAEARDDEDFGYPEARGLD